MAVSKSELIELMRAADKAGDAESVKRLLDIYDRTPEAEVDAPTPQPPQVEFTPEQIESAGFGDLAQTMRGFQQLEEPSSFEQTTDVLANMARAPLARFGKVATDATAGLLKSAAEATLGAEGFDPGAVFREGASPEEIALRATLASIGLGASEARDASVEAIDEFYSPTVRTSEQALESPSEAGAFVGEGVASAAGDIASMALFGLPAYAGSVMANIAQQRVAERGGGPVTMEDLALAAPAAAAITGLNQLALKVGMDPNTAQTLARRAAISSLTETATELPQTAIEVAASQYGARPGGVSGESMEEGLRSALMIAPFAGGGLPVAAAGIRRAGEMIESSPATRDQSLRETVAELETEAAQPPVRQDEPTGMMTVEPVTEEVVSEEVVEPSRDEPAVEAVVEEAITPTNTVPGYYDQVAPPPLPIEAIDEQAEAVQVQMDRDKLAAETREVKKAAKELEEAAKVAPRPSGADIRAVVDKGTKRRRIEKIETPPQPMSAKDAIRRLALVTRETTSTEADVTDAVNEAAAAEIREVSGAISPRNADNIDQIKQLARESGRTDEEIDQMLSHQRMSYADVILAMDERGLRTKLTNDGLGIEVPDATDSLITAVNDGRLSPTNVEIAAIHSTYRSAMAARANVLKAAEQDLDPEALQELNAQDAKLRVVALDALLAQKNGGTPAAQAMRFRQYLIDPVMNVVEAQARARIKKRRRLTDEEVQKIEELWDKASQAEAEAVALEAEAQQSLEAAVSKMKSAERALRASQEVQKEARRRTRKPKKKKKKKTPRQEAAEKEQPPIRVTPLKKSARQKELEKEFKAAEKEARKAADGVQKAKAKARKSQRKKAEVPDAAIRRVKIPGIEKPVDLLGAYRKAFGGSLVLNSSGDNSALGRQALGLAIQMPMTAMRTVPMALKAAPWAPGHRKFAQDTQEEMLASPMQPLRNLAKLEMTEVEGKSNLDEDQDPFNAAEEEFMFRAFETGFIADTLVQPSQNIFGLTLNKLRTEAFDEGARMVAEINGVDLNTMLKSDLRGAKEGTKERQFADDVKGLAKLINVSTGRGSWSAKHLGFLRYLMFAPRYTLSRLEAPIDVLQLAAGVGKYGDVSKGARKLFMRRVGRQMSWGMGMLMMSALAAADNGDDVSDAIDNFFNPESPDYLKMRIGDFHIDALQGFGATWRYVMPFVLSPAGFLEEWYETGDMPDIYEGGDPKGKSALIKQQKRFTEDRFPQLLRNKLAPLLQFMATVTRGSDYRGRYIEGLPRSERSSYQLIDRPSDIRDEFGAKFTPGSQEEELLAYALDTIVFPAMGLVTPITVQQAASAWASNSNDDQKSMIRKAAPLFLNFFGIGTSDYKPKSEQPKIPGMPKLQSTPRMPSLYD